MFEKNKLLPFLVLSLSLMICSCDTINNSDSSINTSTDTASLENSSTNESSSSLNSLDSYKENEHDDTIYTTLVKLDDIKIEINERYSLKRTLKSLKDVKVTFKDEDIATFDDTTKQVIGLKKGVTALILSSQDKLQKVYVQVDDIGKYSGNFSFDYFHLEDKKIVAFGDSVTAEATIAPSKTYYTLFAEHFNMIKVKNYAIGGTTGTYAYFGSNVNREYGYETPYLDGCRVVNNAVNNNEINDVDYAFIAYGHNDQYFQPPIDVKGDENVNINNFSTCNSFSGSYRFMISKLRSANPNIRIILLGCTYSEYDKTNPTRYAVDKDHPITYADYCQAIDDISIEMRCRLILPWNYMKQYFDYNNGGFYYKDSVHLTGNGHQKLYEYIIEN